MPPSSAERPTASTPAARSTATRRLFASPARTAAAISSVAASVTRRPSWKRAASPARAHHAVTSAPPPWTSSVARAEGPAEPASRSAAAHSESAPGASSARPPSFTTSAPVERPRRTAAGPVLTHGCPPARASLPACEGLPNPLTTGSRAPPCTGRPHVSGQPSTMLRFWIACPAAPFTRLSIAAVARSVCPPCTVVTATSQRLEALTSLVSGQLPGSSTRTNGSFS